MLIRKTTQKDLQKIMTIYTTARLFMEANGNTNQWIDGYPRQELIAKDIEKNHSYVCTQNEDILAVFYFAVEEEPNYAQIYHGKWLNEKSYGVVHRIAVDGRQKGIASFCLDWCFQTHENVRIDTHKDNIPMQRLLQKKSYVRCGIIHLADGAERVAFQKAT